MELEAERHPLEAYAESYEQMARCGDSPDARSMAADIRYNMIPATVSAKRAATLSSLAKHLERERDEAREYGKQARLRENAAEDARVHEQHRASIAEAELATLRSDNERLGRERDEALAEIERMTPQFVAYEYLESPAGREIAEAERDTLLAQVGRLREIIARYGDRMRMSYAPAHLQQDIDEAFTAETRAALTKEPS